MRCNVCGAVNDDYLEYCEKCAAPLHGEAPSQPAGSQNSGPSWGFVRSPVWSKPDFNANTISESDLPSDYFSNKAPAGGNAGQGVQPSQPAPAAEEPAAAPAYDAPQPAPRTASGGTACPSCGARLLAGQRFCNACGARMDGAPQAPLSSVAAASGAAASAWSGYSSGAPAGDIKYADPIDESAFSYSIDDEDDGYSARERKPKRAPARPASKSSKSSKSARGGARGRGKSPSRKRNSSNNKVIFLALGAVAAVALIVFGVVMLIKGGVFSGSAITDEPVIEQGTTSNGQLAYNITVYAKKGSTVHFEGGSIVKDAPVAKKSVTYSIPEQVWVPNEPVEGTTLEIYPNITVINKKGDEEAVTFAEPIIINIPSIDMTVTSPNTPQFTVSSPEVAIAGMIGDTSAAIFVNDQQVTVDPTGSFSHTYTLTQPGTNTVNVEARKNGYAINRNTFTIEYSTTAANTPGGATTPGGAGGGASVGDTSAAKSIYYANTDGVNVRSNASTSGNKVGELKLCDKVYVISADSNDWYKIIFNNSEAYVSGAYIRKVSDISAYSTTSATISGDGINARAAASTSADVVTQLSNGTSVSLISQDNNGWSLVEYNNKIFYVSSQYVKK